MIKELYQFGSEYYEKKIFVFGINKDSIDTMLLLSIRKLKVQGFVSDDVKYYGNNIWNIPIVSIEEVNYENSFIIIPKHEKRLPKCFSDKNGVKNIVRYSQMKKTLNQDIFGGVRLVCYGAGYGAFKVSELLKTNGLHITQYLVSQKDKITSFGGMEVNEYKELKNNEALILSVINHGYQKEILNKLCKIENDIYIQTPVEDTVIIQGNTFVLSVDKALKLGHKIFLFDEKNIYTAIYKAIFDLYNVDIEIITNESELVYDPRESLVVINIYESLKRCEFRSILMDKGYELSNFGYTSLFDVTESDEVIMGKTMPVNDALTGVSIMHKNEKIIGWKQLKSKTGYTECKIIILGNSTSQYGLYPFKSWPELLIEKFDDSNMKVTMYVGATSSDDIVSEYLRLVRDYWVIRPDIVISFSGLTNLYDENLLRQFNVSTFWINNSGAFGSGIRTEENHYEFWMRITSMMKQFVEYNGARFLSFLQPMCCFMPEMSLHEKMQFDLSKKAVGAKCFYDNMNEVDDVYFNLLDLFFHKEGMFIDLSHYSETANLIISDIVYKKLIEVKT